MVVVVDEEVEASDVSMYAAVFGVSSAGVVVDTSYTKVVVVVDVDVGAADVLMYTAVSLVPSMGVVVDTSM